MVLFQRLRTVFVVALLFVVVLLVGSIRVYGQDSPTVIINLADLTEQNESQTLNLFFTMVGPDRRVLTDLAPEAAAITLDQGYVVGEVSLSQPRNPLYIALVLDASGSISNQSDAVRLAASEAIRAAPDESLFTVIQFNQEITVLQGFTSNRELALEAVTRYEPDPQGGTCLYDATYRALEILENEAAPSSRRAVILFTDGRDELRMDEPGACSQHTFEEVISLATRASQSAPLYTIGLAGSTRINDVELIAMADMTGGLTEIGNLDRLPSLFQDIMAALRNQWLAQAEVCVATGDRFASLRVSADGAALPPTVREYIVTEGCIPPTVTPTPSPTPTPQPLALLVQTFRFDEHTESATFEVEREGDGDVARFRVQVVDDRGVNLLDFNVDSLNQLTQQVSFDTSAIRDGQIEIGIAALNESNITLARSTRRVAIVRSTPTPAPTITPSRTPEVVSVLLETLTYEQENDRIVLGLSYRQQQQIQEFRIDLINKQTSITSREFRPEVADIIPLDVSGLLPNETYIVRVIAETAAGDRVTAEQEVIIDPIWTPTATLTLTPTATHTLTNTPTPTSTPTPIPPDMQLVGLLFDRNTNELRVDLALQEAQRITEFRATITKRQTRELVRAFEPTIGEQVLLDVSGLEVGPEYLIQFSARTDNGATLRLEDVFIYDPILTPTPTPTNTPTDTPTPSPTPQAAVEIETGRIEDGHLVVVVQPQNPGLISMYRLRLKTTGGIELREVRVDTPPYDAIRMPLENLPSGEYDLELGALDINGNVIAVHSTRVGIDVPEPPPPPPEPNALEKIWADIVAAAQQNPIVFAVVSGLFLLLLAVLIWVVRRVRSGAPGVFPPPNPTPTPVIGSGNLGVGYPPSLKTGEDRTIVDSATDYTIVDTVDDLPPGVSAQLRVIRSENEQSIGSVHPITVCEFTIGRKNSDLSLNAGRISESHATISYSNGRFSIRDHSSGGTIVDNRPVPQNQDIPLKNGSVIFLGTKAKNELRFTINESPGHVYSPDAP